MFGKSNWYSHGLVKVEEIEYLALCFTQYLQFIVGRQHNQGNSAGYGRQQLAVNASKTMKESVKSFLRAFIPGFLATLLGILLTFGVDNWNNARKREKTAHLLAEQIVGKMERTYNSLMEYQELYNTIDSTSMCLHLAIIADTLERVDTSVAVTFINCALSEYVQADVDSGVDAYKDAILSNIGNVELLGHIDEFYSCARQYADVSAQVVNQKRVVSDLVYGHFSGDWYATVFDYVRYLHELPEFNVYYSRMQNVRLSLQEIGQAMEAELERCKEILR